MLEAFQKQARLQHRLSEPEFDFVHCVDIKHETLYAVLRMPTRRRKKLDDKVKVSNAVWDTFKVTYGAKSEQKRKGVEDYSAKHEDLVLFWFGFFTLVDLLLK